MKIILYAFGDKLKSEPIDVPNDKFYYDLSFMEKPIGGCSIMKCRFEWQGKWENNCRIFQLTIIN